MSFPSKLFWAHPDGDRLTLPCTHLVPQHPAGDKIPIPCCHVVQQHPDGHGIKIMGHSITLPCVHLATAHANDSITVPCVHLVPQHPEGHPGPSVPCVHPMSIARVVPDLGLVFYTKNSALQDAAIAAVTRLRAMGITMATPVRPLNVFNRPAANGNPNDANDPFWSHYEPLTHSIQILSDRTDWLDTLHHELGHATLGHSCVQITSGGGPHSLDTPTHPAVAVSEGWAHFVALVLRYSADQVPGSYQGRQWEQPAPGTPRNPNVESCVACALWDLFDRNVNSTDGAADRIALPFQELFRVFSPTLATLFHGPLIPSFDNYLERLKANQPALAKMIADIRRLNCG